MENIGKFRSFRKSNNEQIHIPRKLTGVPGCVRTVGMDSNIFKKTQHVPRGFLLSEVLKKSQCNHHVNPGYMHSCPQ